MAKQPTSLALSATGNSASRASFEFLEQQAAMRLRLDNLVTTERWTDMMYNAHDRAFTVAGAMKADLLKDLASALDGNSLEGFRKDFDKIVANHGWDYVGERNWRTRVIYKTNMATSYASGRLAQLTDPKLLSIAPYWTYVHNDSVIHPRPMHKQWGDMKLTLIHSHVFWETHFTPNGWGCHCYITASKKPKEGYATEPPNGWDLLDGKTGAPAGIDKGWDYMPGKSVTDELRSIAKRKSVELPKKLSSGYQDDMAALLRRPIVMTPGTNVDFARSVKAAYMKLPSSWRDVVSEAGYPIVITTRLTDALPRLKTSLPRGVPNGVTWEHLDGMFSPRDRILVVAQESLIDGIFVPTGAARAAGALTHEFGHALDEVLRMSSNDQLLSAWRPEAEALRKKSFKLEYEQYNQQYFTQNEPDGVMETVAELVARFNNARTGESLDALVYFPNTAKILRELLPKD